MIRQRPLDETQRMLEQTLIPSPNVSTLELDDLASTVERFRVSNGLVSEQYHLISKLNPRTVSRKPPGRESDFVHKWYFDSVGQGADRLVEQGSSKVTNVPAELGTVLSPFMNLSDAIMCLYYVDVIVYYNGVLWKQVPGKPLLTWEGRVQDPQVLALSRFLGVSPQSGNVLALGFVVGAFTRSAFLLGERAYRRTLLNAGIALETMRRHSSMADSTTLFRYTDLFLDDEVDRVLANDGVERGTLACFALERIQK